MKITLSHKVCDEEDFLKRERLSIMNESLRPLCEHTVEKLSTALTELGLKCPFYFTRRDGKLIRFDIFPILHLYSKESKVVMLLFVCYILVKQTKCSFIYAMLASKLKEKEVPPINPMR